MWLNDRCFASIPVSKIATCSGDLGLRVSSFGLGASGFGLIVLVVKGRGVGFRVSGSDVRVLGWVFRFGGLRFGVWDLGLRV